MKLVQIVAILVMLGIVLFIDAAFVEPNRLVITQNTYNLFNSTDPIKVILISDIHIGSQNKGHLENVVKVINEQNADLVLIAGDSINYDEKELEKLEPLKELKTKSYAVLGNHDYGEWGCPIFSDSLELSNKVESRLENLGIEVLRNEHQIVTIKNKKFALVGLDDAWVCRNDYAKATENIENVPQIIMMHNQLAVNFNEVKENSLVLAGHTHCGEVRIPFITDFLFFSILKKSRFGDLVGGHYALTRGINLYVTCGVTKSTTGLRFFTNPEISVITIN